MDSGDKYLIIIILIMVLAAAVPAVLSYYVVKKYQKTYWLFNHSIILYPYYYMTYIVAALVAMSNDIYFSGETQVFALFVIFLVNPLTLGVLISDFVINAHGHVEPERLARLNMIIKLVHIPAYVIHFVLGLLGTLASVWGIGFILWAVIIDLITIAITGTHAVSCVIGISKKKTVNKWILVTAAILSYIYCVDVVVSIVFYIIVRKKSRSLSVADNVTESYIRKGFSRE